MHYVTRTDTATATPKPPKSWTASDSLHCANRCFVFQYIPLSAWSWCDLVPGEMITTSSRPSDFRHYFSLPLSSRCEFRLTPDVAHDRFVLSVWCHAVADWEGWRWSFKSVVGQGYMGNRHRDIKRPSSADKSVKQASFSLPLIIQKVQGLTCCVFGDSMIHIPPVHKNTVGWHTV